MISKQEIKLIKSLTIKKNRNKHQMFIVEGRKSIAELFNSDYEIESLFANDSWIKDNKDKTVIRVSNSELERISNFKSPNDVLAIVKIKNNNFQPFLGITLVLDDINDPGNLGTIIRTCDWFNVSTIVCSKNTVDSYNPKVVQSAMGSIFRVAIKYTNLSEFLSSTSLPVFGAFIEGNDIKKIVTPKNLILVLGNEARGISDEVTQLIAKKIKVNSPTKRTESLNVASAAAILLHEICT